MYFSQLVSQFFISKIVLEFFYGTDINNIVSVRRLFQAHYIHIVSSRESGSKTGSNFFFENV